MAGLQKPEDLAYKATELIETTTSKSLKEKSILTAAVMGVSLGMMALLPQGTMPALALMTVFNLWDTKRSRDTAVKIRDSFNQMAEDLADHESTFQMAPLQKSCAQIKNFGKDDLNLIAHFKKNKFDALFLGAISLVNPIVAPLALSALINISDLKKIRAIKNSAKESNANLCKKYPTQFPTNML